METYFGLYSLYLQSLPFVPLLHTFVPLLHLFVPLLHLFVPLLHFFVPLLHFFVPSNTPLCTLITSICTLITPLCTLVYTSLAFCEVHIVTYSIGNQSKTDVLWEILTKSDIIFKSCDPTKNYLECAYIIPYIMAIIHMKIIIFYFWNTYIDINIIWKCRLDKYYISYRILKGQN